jgi:hypothetical protein
MKHVNEEYIDASSYKELEIVQHSVANYSTFLRVFVLNPKPLEVKALINVVAYVDCSHEGSLSFVESIYC